MGLFDDLVDGKMSTQVKCFYNPSYDAGFGVQHIGGDMKTYNKGDVVPVETIYYHYPDNFYVYIDGYSDDDVGTYIPIAVFHNQRFEGFLSRIDDASVYSDFYSYYGRKILVSNVDELKQHIAAMKAEHEKPPGVRDFIEFGKRWYEPLSLEHQLGELVVCWEWSKIFTYTYIDEIYSQRNKRNVEELKENINEFRDLHPILFDECMSKWEVIWEVVYNGTYTGML
jgi:hypothetical protein